jgi:uncharacterized protein (TIGR00725 family)
MTQRVPYIGVVGTGEADEQHERTAETVGAELARAGAVVVCGGLGGVMAAACRGAREAGGVTLGLLPGSDRDAANPWVSLAVPTGMGELRNGLIVRAADALVAVGGGFGTLSEIALALKLGRPVVGVGTWDIGSGVVSIDDPIAATRKALQLVTSSSQT